jgi:hypothetical protein
LHGQQPPSAQARKQPTAWQPRAAARLMSALNHHCGGLSVGLSHHHHHKPQSILDGNGCRMVPVHGNSPATSAPLRALQRSAIGPQISTSPTTLRECCGDGLITSQDLDVMRVAEWHPHRPLPMTTNAGHWFIRYRDPLGLPVHPGGQLRSIVGPQWALHLEGAGDAVQPRERPLGQPGVGAMRWPGCGSMGDRR